MTKETLEKANEINAKIEKYLTIMNMCGGFCADYSDYFDREIAELATKKYVQLTEDFEELK